MLVRTRTTTAQPTPRRSTFLARRKAKLRAIRSQLATEWRSTEQLSSSQQRTIRSKQHYVRQTIQFGQGTKKQPLQPRLSQCATERTKTVNATHKSTYVNTQYKLFHVPVKIDNILTYALIDTQELPLVQSQNISLIG